MKETACTRPVYRIEDMKSFAEYCDDAISMKCSGSCGQGCGGGCSSCSCGSPARRKKHKCR